MEVHRSWMRRYVEAITSIRPGKGGYMAYAPHLTEAQIDRIRIYAKPRQVVAGEILYEPGFDTPPVYVVISGAIRIVAVGGKEERVVTKYRSGQFSGELLMI